MGTVDYFEIDFLNVGESQSGDAIALRYERQGNTFVHVVDGGFQDDGPNIMAHLRKYYGGNGASHVVLTHPDSDHAGGLVTVLEECEVPPGGGLWMLRPWLYASELIDHFARFTTVGGLEEALREAYPNVAALEAIAERRGIPIYEPFQGAMIGEFTVLAPSKARYLQLIVDSERTPKEAAPTGSVWLIEALQSAAAKVIRYVKAAWGVEVFSTEPTSAENEMSVVQYTSLCDEKILITGDVGREGLTEAADFAPLIGLELPGIDRFDVPHHGSRRNVSTEVLDRWLGPRLPQQLPDGQGSFQALISANPDDKEHPRRAVVRGLIHRGANVVQTTGKRGAYLRTSKDAPPRDDAVPAKRLPYPEDQEED
ncbi:MAG: MBL fold metallo-hydrolase [Acidobacteriia bacterium]|nr:MBL fold metallo-hydrolase [Terriglobia bacterium]MYF78987.1 MBL fold metallo-hydrolase [Chloroflexota bacterium]MYK08049.1 MBL fold metallo-hydrolase [Terriglobia bacterium]